MDTARFVKRLAPALSLAAGCGLFSRDFDVSQEFQAGGGAPPFSGQFSGAALTGQLSSDLNKISSVTLKAARIEAVDGAGDISFLSDATLTASANRLATVQLATLPSPPAAGATSVQLSVDSSRELKPYLQAGGAIGAFTSYSPTPATARTLKLTLTLHGSLF